MARQGTKRSESSRIYEYFNEVLAEIRPQKTDSDYTRHPKGVAMKSDLRSDEILLTQYEISCGYEIFAKWQMLRVCDAIIIIRG